MASILTITVDEYNDATKFRLYDRTDWNGGFDSTQITSVLVTVTFNDTDYTLKLYDTADSTDLIGLASSYVTLFGESVNSSYDVAAVDLLDSEGIPFTPDRYPDGFYEIRIDVAHTTDGGLYDTPQEGFLAHAFCKATQLPLLIDFNNFDTMELRVQSLLIALLHSAKRAAELGRESQFTNKVKALNAFFKARNLSDCW